MQGDVAQVPFLAHLAQRHIAQRLGPAGFQAQPAHLGRGGAES